jgi:hypothetical protein
MLRDIDLDSPRYMGFIGINSYFGEEFVELLNRDVLFPESFIVHI